MKRFNLHKCVWYFLIYSIIGMILENVFCYLTSHNIESRKGLLIGPFCPIYGIGAIVLTFFLEPKKNSIAKVFLLGATIGSIFEYISSYCTQAIYGVKFWDYSEQLFNLNGRSTIMYALIWGVLSLLLIYFVNPIVNRKVNDLEIKSLDIIILIYMCTNTLLTYGTICTYIENIENFIEYGELQDNNRLFTNEVMKVVFPNIRYVIDSNNSVPVTELLNKELK